MATPGANPTGSDPESQPRITFSIRAIMVVTAVMAASAAGAAHLWRAAHGSAGDIGPFVIVTSVGPLGLMIIASWLFRLFRN